MARLRKVVRVLRRGEYVDSGMEQLRYWVTRPPAERVAAGRDLVRTSYRRVHGRPLPGVKRIVRRVVSKP